MAKKYFIGLDCGTNSVGFAVTDEKYKILRAKGKSLWGARLFDEAETAATRRSCRSNRRRHQRAKSRIKLLKMIFRDEISKVDPDFYTRLRESFYLEEDKNFRNIEKRSKNTLFNDSGFKDKDFHKKYPTIWHLRQAIVKGDGRLDIRLYFLAILHMMKNRGHFLFEGNLRGGNNFSLVFSEFKEVAERCGFVVDERTEDKLREIIEDHKGSLRDKKKVLAQLIGVVDDEAKLDVVSLAGLVIGSQVTLEKIFGIEPEEKGMSLSFAKIDMETKLPDIEQAVELAENLDLVLVAKKLYDYGVLHKLLGGADVGISDAMVRNYEQHQKDLKELKKYFKQFPEEYEKLFKVEKFDEKFPSYNAYIGKAYTEDKKGRRSTTRVDQAELNKQLLKLFNSHNYEGELWARAERGELLPKQKGQAKGTIPQQLHHNELEIILDKLGENYPSFKQKVEGESEEYNTKCKKLAILHSFRIPYYCGPLVNKKRSEFSWADEEIREVVYPWNFKELVKLDERANKFIKRMTNECSYLLGEEVLPKNSLVYQRYMVLDELNNLKINGRRIADVEMKQKIFEQAFRAGELRGSLTLKTLKRWMVNNGMMMRGDDLGGTNEVKILPTLKTHRDLVRILGEGYAKKYDNAKLERVIEAITILGEEKKILGEKILRELGCSEEEAGRLAKLGYKDWGRMSGKFLNGIRAEIKGREMKIIEALYETNHNLMELLSTEYVFSKKVEESNAIKRSEGGEITYEDVKKLYCSPAVKRTVWQAIKIVQEIVRVKGEASAKIFIEVTRGEDRKQKGKLKLSRRVQLLEKYKKFKETNQGVLKELEGKEDRDLQSKKLYLYFMQGGRCAYSGERIDIERLITDAYDIDHIYPRSKTKDDSIERNLVLVKAELNREKTNVYPIRGKIRDKMRGVWADWMRMELITKEKFYRLMRATPLTEAELGEFIARQIVETSQSVKAIKDLLMMAFPETKVITVKAGQVADFRHLFGNDKKERGTGRIIKAGRPEFIKVREINDFHHAKDAYLNIVVGNVMNLNFSSDPRKWIKERQGADYTINPRVLFREREEYRTRADKLTKWPEVAGWNYGETVEMVSGTMRRNDVLWTRMSYVESKEISKLTILGKGKDTKGILPIKSSKRLSQTEKYGGYTSMFGAHFSLIKNNDNKRRLIQIPIIYQHEVIDYVRREYAGFEVVIPVIRFKSLVKVDGFPLHLSGMSGGTILGYQAKQALFEPETAKYIKQVVNVYNKLKEKRGEYEIDSGRDGVTIEKNQELGRKFFEKLKMLKAMPGFGGKVEEILAHRGDFDRLEIKQQVYALMGIMNVFGCNAVEADLSMFVPAAAHTGKVNLSWNLDKYEKVELVHQSVTGLFERVIDLKRVERA